MEKNAEKIRCTACDTELKIKPSQDHVRCRTCGKTVYKTGNTSASRKSISRGR